MADRYDVHMTATPIQPPPHMTPEAFRIQGQAVVEWIASYIERVQRDEFPVLSPIEPGEVRARLPHDAPVEGEPFEQILRDVNEIIMPGITHWQSPSFFGYYPANTSGPAILGELLSAGLGVQGMLWSTSPACTELETLMLDWVARMLGLPERFLSSSQGGGVIQDTASSAALCALIAARQRILATSRGECGAGRCVAYCSSEAHSSIEKAVRIAGLGSEHLRLIETDEHRALRPDALAASIRTDKKDDLLPCFVCATVGTTSTGTVDPVRKMGEICREHGIWLHVDAAMSGTAAICPEFRGMHDGLELADSYCFNPHKWMLTNFDCDCFYVANRAALVGALSILPEYLRNKASESGAVIDYRDWQVPLGRRFRALKLWFVIRYYGIEGLQRHVRHHVELARQFAAWVQEDERFELAVEPRLNLVCFRLAPPCGDIENERLLETLNASGKLLLTHTRLDGRYTLRMAIGGTYTREQHVHNAWRLIQSGAADLISLSSQT